MADHQTCGKDAAERFSMLRSSDNRRRAAASYVPFSLYWRVLSVSDQGQKMARHPLRLAPQRLFELAFEAPASRRREMLFVGFDFRARRVKASLEAAPFTRLSHVVLG